MSPEVTWTVSRKGLTFGPGEANGDGVVLAPELGAGELKAGVGLGDAVGPAGGDALGEALGRELGAGVGPVEGEDAGLATGVGSGDRATDGLAADDATMGVVPPLLTGDGCGDVTLGNETTGPAGCGSGKTGWLVPDPGSALH
ncbi:MAG: hypothetical protein ACR2PL_24225 [Dehalococcoidia bacterium]